LVVYWPCTWPELPTLSCYTLQHCHQIGNSLVLTLDRPLNLVLPDQGACFQQEGNRVLPLIIICLIFFQSPNSSLCLFVFVFVLVCVHVCACVHVCVFVCVFVFVRVGITKPDAMSQADAMLSHYSLVSYWFTLLLRYSQWGLLSWLTSSLLFQYN
jgi:hypothetical protein